MSNLPSSEKKLKLDINDEFINDSVLNANLGHEIFVTTSDKIKLNLIDYRNKLLVKKSWMTPLGIDVSLLAAICTSDFKDFFGITSSEIRSLFIFSAAACTVWFLYSLGKALESYWKHRNVDDSEYFINSLRKK